MWWHGTGWMSWLLRPCPMREPWVWWLVAAFSAIIKGISYHVNVSYHITSYHLSNIFIFYLLSYITYHNIYHTCISIYIYKIFIYHSSSNHISYRSISSPFPMWISSRWATWILPVPRASPLASCPAPGRRCARWPGSSSRRPVESRWWSAQAPPQVEHGGWIMIHDDILDDNYQILKDDNNVVGYVWRCWICWMIIIPKTP